MGRRRNSSLSRVPGSGRGPCTVDLRIKQGQAVDPTDLAGVTRGTEMGQWLFSLCGEGLQTPLCSEIKSKIAVSIYFASQFPDLT